MFGPACVSCQFLGKCREVDVDKLMSNYFCTHWSSHPKIEEVHARIAILQNYGRAGADTLVHLPREDE